MTFGLNQLRSLVVLVQRERSVGSSKILPFFIVNLFLFAPSLMELVKFFEYEYFYVWALEVRADVVGAVTHWRLQLMKNIYLCNSVHFFVYILWFRTVNLWLFKWILFPWLNWYCLNVCRRLEERKNKRKKTRTEEHLEFPRHEQIKFGEVVDAPPKLVALPKVDITSLLLEIKEP